MPVSSALPSVQPGCSRQRVIELGEGRVGLPMLLREVVPLGTFGLAPPELGWPRWICLRGAVGACGGLAGGDGRVPAHSLGDDDV
jgi:hypothetical protein